MSETQTIVLRRAKADDAEAIHAMILALAEVTRDGHRVTGRVRDIRRYGFGPEALFDCLIAERADAPVGLCLYFYSFSTWLGEPGVYVQDLFVSETERGTGLGRRLLQAVAAEGRARNATHLRLTVDANNRQAKLFYAAVGMTCREQEETYHIGGEAFARLAERKA